MKQTILVVDDEEHVRSSLRRALQDEPYDVVLASGGAEALALMKERQFAVVVSDERMPGMDGAEFLCLVRDRYPATVRIMLTGYASVEATMQAVNRGEIYRFFTKPWDDTMLKLGIRSGLEKFAQEEEGRFLMTRVRLQERARLMIRKTISERCGEPGQGMIGNDPAVNQ
jgi:DNA-binding NtrC family response regulator